MNCKSECIPRPDLSGLRGMRANPKMANFLTVEDSLQLAAGIFKKGMFFVFLLVLALMTAGPASAHFGMVIPSDQMVMQGENTNIKVDLMFWHPFEGIGMELVKPARFAVVINGKETGLLGSLKPTKTKGHQTWTANYRIKRPGVYVFCMEPQPYWEPTEDCYIIHYTKAVVTAFGANYEILEDVTIMGEYRRVEQEAAAGSTFEETVNEYNLRVAVGF